MSFGRDNLGGTAEPASFVQQQRRRQAGKVVLLSWELHERQKE